MHEVAVSDSLKSGKISGDWFLINREFKWKTLSKNVEKDGLGW